MSMESCFYCVAIGQGALEYAIDCENVVAIGRDAGKYVIRAKNSVIINSMNVPNDIRNCVYIGGYELVKDGIGVDGSKIDVEDFVTSIREALVALARPTDQVIAQPFQ
jgi:hypothetical protein